MFDFYEKGEKKEEKCGASGGVKQSIGNFDRDQKKK